MAETLTIELKDAVAGGPLPPPPAPPAYQLPAPAQAVPMPLRPPSPAEAARPVPLPAVSAPLEIHRDVLSRLSAVLERLAASLAQAAPAAPGRAGAAVPAAPAAAAPARLPAPPLGPGAPPAGAREELTPPAPKSKRLGWDEVQALFGVGAMPAPPASMPPPPSGFDFGPLPAAQTRPAPTGPVIVQAPDVTVEAPQVPAPPQPAAPRPALVPHPDDSAERLEAKRRQAHSEREKAIRDEQDKLKVLEVQPLSDWEKNTRPGLRVGPKDDPATADAKRRQQHSEYEQEVYRRRKELMPPAPPQPGAAMQQLGQIGQAAGAVGGAGGKAASAAGTGLAGLGQLQAALAPGGAAAAGGLAGAAALAGPIGLMATAAIELRNQVREGLRSRVEGIGQTIRGVASLDTKMLDRAVEHGFTEAVERLGARTGSLPLMMLGPAVGEAFKQANQVVDATVGTARRLANVSGPLANAFGQAEVRHIMGELVRQRLLTERLVGIVEARSRKEEAQANVEATALAIIAPLLERWEAEQANFWEGLYKLLRQIAEKLGIVSEATARAPWDEIMGAAERGWWGRLGDAFRARPEPPPIGGRRAPLGGLP